MRSRAEERGLGKGSHTVGSNPRAANMSSINTCPEKLLDPETGSDTNGVAKGGRGHLPLGNAEGCRPTPQAVGLRQTVASFCSLGSL